MSLRPAAVFVAASVALVACGTAKNTAATTVAAPAGPTPNEAVSTRATTTSTTATAQPTSTGITPTQAPTTEAPTTTVLGDPLPIHLDGGSSGEGEWKVAVSLADGPVLWKTAVRPFPTNRAIVLFVAAFDQSRLQAALFNSGVLASTDPPQQGSWANKERVPEVLRPALVAAFNSGFMLRHIKGGYLSEGKEVKPLVDGQMTLAIDREGRLSIGVYGTDLVDDGTYAVLRQNLPPVVRDGASVIAENPRIYWGDQAGDKTVFRSALCTLPDGRLAYVATRPMTIDQLAQGLVAIGCRLAMQLDVNFNHVFFSSFAQPGGSQPLGKVLDPWMLNPNRVFGRTTMDFVALFDRAGLEPGVLA